MCKAKEVTGGCSVGKGNSVEERLPVPLSIEAMMEAIASAHRVFSILQERIEPVLRPADPRPSCDGPSYGCSPVASALSGQVADIARLAERIEDVISRLEL